MRLRERAVIGAAAHSAVATAIAETARTAVPAFGTDAIGARSHGRARPLRHRGRA
jgi:hypothetical protein